MEAVLTPNTFGGLICSAPFCSTNSSSDRIRVERIETDLDYTYASSFVENFYAKRARQNGGIDGDAASAVTEFPRAVILALAYAIRYLEDFQLSSSLLHTQTSFKRFNNVSHMLLNANTLNNLEVYRNSDDGGQKGSLFWLLDHCCTKAGRRLLREWVGRPLVNKESVPIIFCFPLWLAFNLTLSQPSSSSPAT